MFWVPVSRVLSLLAGQSLAREMFRTIAFSVECNPPSKKSGLVMVVLSTGTNAYDYHVCRGPWSHMRSGLDPVHSASIHTHVVTFRGVRKAVSNLE